MKTRILIGTDGSYASLGAMRVGRELAAKLNAEVEVVTVVEPIPLFGVSFTGMIATTKAEIEQAALAAARERAEAQLAEIGLSPSRWPLHVELGPAAPTLVRAAQQQEASLILLGLGEHALSDRWLGSETALRVMRVAHVPVLAVPAAATDLPGKAVVAVDFSEFSRDAARTVSHIVRPGGQVHLVHVYWRPSEETPWVGGMDWVNSYRESINLHLTDLARVLEGLEDVRVEVNLLEGSPAKEVLRFAERVGADLVAAGSHGVGFLGRVLMGSVSTRLVRGAQCSVLISPPRTVPLDLQQELVGAERREVERAVVDGAATDPAGSATEAAPL